MTTAASGRPGLLVAVAWMGVTLAAFSLMMVAARELGHRMSVFEMLTFRCLVSLAILAPVTLPHGWRAFRTRRPGLQALRNAVHFAGQCGWIYGVTALPLATVVAMEFTTPIWIALLAALALGERLARHRLLAVGLGFAGVLVILRPGIEAIDPATLVVLAAAACYGASNVMVKALTRADGAMTIVLMMQLMQLPLAAVPAVWGWTPVLWADAPWLFLLGATGLAAHYGMARAYALADVTVVGPIDFLRLPVTATIGFLVYGERMHPFVFLGAALIFAGNFQSIRRESRRLAG